MGGSHRIPRAVAEDVRFSTWNHQDERPSNSHLDSSYGYSQSLRTKTHQGGSGTQARARVVLASGGRRLRPIAGGAPFLTCSNCFELLLMPRKARLMVEKAEKMAGPIQPGQYWYDSRAGFWGVLGGPCLGIIRPWIEEFNYTMPENCAGGTTGVIVNGRELHEKDLDLLAKRGLPTDKDRSYIIEISGKVLDVGTGEELHKLGKLAPTVEKAKHGFGMKVRRAAPQ